MVFFKKGLPVALKGCIKLKNASKRCLITKNRVPEWKIEQEPSKLLAFL